MRVLLVANTLPPTDLSGVGEQVLQLTRGLEERGHEVEILGRGERGARGPKVLFPLTVVLPLVRRLRSFRPDVVQVHESDGALAALVCKAVRGVADPIPRLVALLQVSYLEELRAVRPLVANGRVLGRPGAVERRFRWLKAPFQIALGCLTAWLADVVVAPSRRTAEEIERDYQVGPVTVLPNVTDRDNGDRRGPIGDDSTPGQAGPDEGSPAPYLLFVGRLRIRKGVEVLLEALAEPPLPAELRIAGDGEHRQALEKRAKALGLGDRVGFLGRQSAAEVDALLTGARALVVPSTYEGMPLVILEAMEASVPVVASAVSGIPEVVVDGETGWLVPPEDPAALRRAVDHAVTDPAEASRRGENGRARLDRCFRPRHAARQWEEAVGAGSSKKEEERHG